MPIDSFLPLGKSTDLSVNVAVASQTRTDCPPPAIASNLPKRRRSFASEDEAAEALEAHVPPSPISSMDIRLLLVRNKHSLFEPKSSFQPPLPKANKEEQGDNVVASTQNEELCDRAGLTVSDFPREEDWDHTEELIGLDFVDECDERDSDIFSF
jgi:hypothetical protein